jgi:hypothetical protein
VENTIDEMSEMGNRKGERRVENRRDELSGE